MIEFEKLTFSYPDERGQGEPVLCDLTLSIEEGEFVLVVGPSGSGKSTLLRCINGLVPHFYGGTLSGYVRVHGRDPIALEPRRMSELVGFVFQDPEAQAVVDTVEDELAFAMENQGMSSTVMRKRIEEVLDQLNIAHLRGRKLSTLSGGERQRVAIGAVLTCQPQVLVLDEPTSQLDPQAAEEVLDTLVKLNHDLGLTIVLSEHRLERVAQYADKILYLAGKGQPPLMGEPRAVLAQIPLVPPLVELGKKLGWAPLPLTIKEARKWLKGLKIDLEKPQTARLATARAGDPVLKVQGVYFAYNGTQTLRDIDLTVQRGEFLAIMGRNGAGKSTLLKHCIGLLKPDAGRVSVLGLDTQSVPVAEMAMHVGYVPQNPNALLFADTVAQELSFTRQAQGLSSTGDEAFLETVGLGGLSDRYPRDLSAGERQRVAMASVLVGNPDLILLDEPTRGLDYAQKELLIALLQTQRQRYKTVVVVTHDVELVARCAERVVLMGNGEIIVDGPVREVMSDSQVFASQINKLFRDPRYLTVQDVQSAVGEHIEDRSVTGLQAP
ncbi:MAG: ABC transporter ATP-binding protein [Anaerolineae bacterium]|nr:ABC transporter ATP-binding protein [Anaerolineae bacterium]